MLQFDTYLCIQAVLLCTFFVKLIKLKDDLQKISRYDLKNQRKSVPSTVSESLAYALIHLGAFGSAEARFHSKNLILPYFSSLSMVAISVPFPEKGLRAVYWKPHTHIFRPETRATKIKEVGPKAHFWAPTAALEAQYLQGGTPTNQPNTIGWGCYRSVLGVFWAPLSQMTFTPPHFYPKYVIWSKVIFLVEDPFIW